MSENLIELIKELSEKKYNTDKDIQKILRKYPKNDSGLYRKSDIRKTYIQLINDRKIKFENHELENLEHNLKMKSSRTISGVTPVTVLTKPFPCPGKCIFCPNDIRMPKSYLSDEPGAQRATRNKFDPYAQTYNRLMAYKIMGHSTDKIELIVLGGTWTSYPENYQIWFIKRCFDALNDFNPDNFDFQTIEITHEQPYDEDSLKGNEVNGEKIDLSYNQIVSKSLIPKQKLAESEKATWNELFESQKDNVNAKCRSVGLVIETRPDEINEKEVIRIRKLGATKTQIGFQSLSDEVLELNHRGHDVNTTRNAVSLLRKAGFKIHAHWMPNLYGSSPNKDIEDFKVMFSDKDFKPDELKVYPCSLIDSAELMDYYKKGLWKPYTLEELKYVLKEIYKLTPNYCRITRMIRDIGSHDIVTGNKVTNLRELIEKELNEENADIKEIRHREIRNKQIKKDELKIKITEYETSISNEYFLEYITKNNNIAGFLRLSIPNNKSNFIEELEDSAMIREVHVYGESIQIGLDSKGKAQHLGLGKNLIKKAEEIVKENDFNKIAVISAIGTRGYYKKLGYELIDMYQVKNIF